MSDKPERDDYSLKPDGLIDYQDAVIDWQEKEIEELRGYIDSGIPKTGIQIIAEQVDEIKELKQRIAELESGTFKKVIIHESPINGDSVLGDLVIEQQETIAKLREALELVAESYNSWIVTSPHMVSMEVLKVARAALKECFGKDK